MRCTAVVEAQDDLGLMHDVRYASVAMGRDSLKHNE